MEDVKISRRRSERRGRVDIEQLDPEYRTGILDGYAKAIQELGQSRRDRILERIIRRTA